MKNTPPSLWGSALLDASCKILGVVCDTSLKITATILGREIGLDGKLYQNLFEKYYHDALYLEGRFQASEDVAEKERIANEGFSLTNTLIIAISTSMHPEIVHKGMKIEQEKAVRIKQIHSFFFENSPKAQTIQESDSPAMRKKKLSITDEVEGWLKAFGIEDFMTCGSRNDLTIRINKQFKVNTRATHSDTSIGKDRVFSEFIELFKKLKKHYHIKARHARRP